MTRQSPSLPDVSAWLDGFFAIDRYDRDPAFSRHLPAVYEAIGVDWRSFVEPAFAARFNGLMLSGDDRVGRLWLLSFPEATTLGRLLDRTAPGDLIFAHHPIDMRCGDPRGAMGEGFIPIPPALRERLRQQRVSFYACHAPLDVHPRFSPSGAIVNVIGGTPLATFLDGAGILGAVAPTTATTLALACQTAIPLPYVELVGDPAATDITRVAVVGGGAGDVQLYAEAERLGAGCLITGEVTSRIDNERGRQKQAAIARFRSTSNLPAIGLSHAGSEFLVMKELAPFFETELGIPAEAVHEDIWWR